MYRSQAGTKRRCGELEAIRWEYDIDATYTPEETIGHAAIPGDATSSIRGSPRTSFRVSENFSRRENRVKHNEEAGTIYIQLD